MTGFLILRKHEFHTAWKTWHHYVLPTVLCLFGVTSVILPRFTPDIAGSIMGDAIYRTMPEPNWHEAYSQWIKNLVQAVMFVVIFTGAGATSSPVSSDRVQLLVARPTSRASQPLVTLVARITMFASASVAGMAVVWAATFGFYRKALVTLPAAAIAIRFVCVYFFLAVTVAIPSLTGSTLATTRIEAGSLLLIMIGSTFEPIAESLFVGPLALPSPFAKGGTVGAAAVTAPFTTNLVLTVLIVVLETKSFAGREL